METNFEVLLDNKKEYIEHVLDIFTIPLAKKIYELFNDSYMNFKLFQDNLVNIKNWNNNKIKDQYNIIIKKTKCTYLHKILKKIVFLDFQIKLQKTTDFIIPDNYIINPEDFIHKCLVNISVYCWKNIYLFATKNLKPSEKQYHLNLIEKNIKKIIKNTIREITPFDKLFDYYDAYKSNNINKLLNKGGNNTELLNQQIITPKTK